MKRRVKLVVSIYNSELRKSDVVVDVDVFTVYFLLCGFHKHSTVSAAKEYRTSSFIL